MSMIVLAALLTAQAASTASIAVSGHVGPTSSGSVTISVSVRPKVEVEENPEGGACIRVMSGRKRMRATLVTQDGKAIAEDKDGCFIRPRTGTVLISPE